MGIVYVCLNPEFNLLIALKTFQDHYILSEKEVNAFKNEAKAWLQLEKHPNIITAITFDIIEDRPFIILELVLPDENNHKTLEDHINNSDLSIKQILDWSIQLCHGMDYAVSQGVNHRDIKPANLMIEGNLLKITDFGLAKIWNDKSQSNNPITSYNENEFSIFKISAGTIIAGTPGYMAPEIFLGKSDMRSDIYSFGMVLYQMLIGEHSFYYDNDDHLNLHNILKVNSEIFLIIKKCLEKNPENRYQDFKELKKDLEEIYIKKINEDIYVPPKTKIDADEHSNRAYGFEKLGLTDKSIQESQKALQKDPNSFLARMNMGIAFNKLEKPDNAIIEFQKALQINNQDAMAYYNLGNAFSYNNQFKEAFDSYHKSIKINPESKECHVNLGNLLRNNDKVEESLYHYKKALNIDPDFYMAKMNLAIAFIFKEDFERALKLFEDAEKNCTNDPNYIFLGELHIA